MKDLDGNSSHRNTTENNKVLQETKSLMAQLKLSLNDGEAEDLSG